MWLKLWNCYIRRYVCSTDETFILNFLVECFRITRTSLRRVFLLLTYKQWIRNWCMYGLKQLPNRFDVNNLRIFQGLLQKAEALYQRGDFEFALVFYHRGNKLRPELQGFRLGIQKAQEAINNSIGGKTCL